MTSEEINEVIEERFKNIARYFRRSVDNFEPHDISQFRIEIKKIKVFLRLLSMESEDGLSYRISRRMRTIYGYFSTIHNFQLHLEETNDCLKKSVYVPVCYMDMLGNELAYWKRNSKNFLDADYDFSNDKRELIDALPGQLTIKSIQNFLQYTLYELQEMSGCLNDTRIDSARKFMEDIYYNFSIIRPYLNEQQTNLFDKKAIGECLGLFDDFRSKRMSIALLQTFDTTQLDGYERQLLKQKEDTCLHEKEELRNELCARLASMHIQTYSQREFAFAGSSN